MCKQEVPKIFPITWVLPLQNILLFVCYNDIVKLKSIIYFAVDWTCLENSQKNLLGITEL
ncbi:hypothetical protein DF216_10860 [Streptococcus oralis]|uniref:Uncharacterized protein n=1 Tax=Streptococcus oralis TaxID=1303 RepID=A0A4Q2FDA6_STROR|nr:hypothetical protein DF216_10860 [Streptococcus oralis]